MQANEADIKKQATVYCDSNPTTVEVTGKIPIGFNRPQETNHLPNGHRSEMPQQCNILRRDTVRIIVTQAARFEGNWKRITNYKG